MSAPEIKTLRENVSELKTQVVHNDKKLDRIIYILNNDEGTGQPGLVSQVKSMQGKVNLFIEEYEKKEAVKKGKLGLMATIFGAIGTSIAFFFKYIFDKFF